MRFFCTSLTELDMKIEQTVNDLLGGLKGGAAMSKPIATCMTVGVSSYYMMSAKDRVHIDELIATTRDLVENLKPAFLKFQQRMSHAMTDVSKITELLKLGNRFLRRKRTVELIQEYLSVYADVLYSPKRIKAIGAYLVCVVSNMETKYKEAVIAAIDLMFTVIHIVSTTHVRADLRGKSGKLFDCVHKYVMRPLYKDLAASAKSSAGRGRS